MYSQLFEVAVERCDCAIATGVRPFWGKLDGDRVCEFAGDLGEHRAIDASL